jgi:hypothetical protein
MSSASFAKALNAPHVGTAILIGVAALAALAIYRTLRDDTVKLAEGVSEAAGGIITGRNTLTANTAYEGAGVFGTLGAGVDSASGNSLSAVGEWIGGTLYDWFGDDPETNLSENSTGNPYSPTGPTAGYRKAANDSPVNAQYRASAFTVQ